MRSDRLCRARRRPALQRATYAYARIQLRPLGRPFAGAELGIADGEQIGKVIGVELQLLERETGASVEELAADGAAAGPPRASTSSSPTCPPTTLLQLADAVADQPVLLLQRHRAGRQRCAPPTAARNVAHVIRATSC